MPHATLGVLLASDQLTDLQDWSILVYIILYFSLITFACNINCLYDIEVDKLHKKKLGMASESLGINNIKIILILELVLIFFLIYFLWVNNHLVTFILAILGLVLATIYSMSPIRLKAKGILSPLPVIIGLYTLPIIGGWFLIENTFSLYFVVFVIGYALMNEGFTLVNTCEDCQEDKETGIKTWAHIIGLKKTLNLAFIFSLFGYVCVLALVFKTLILSPFSDLKMIVVVVLLCLSLITVSISILDVWNTTKGSDLELSAKRYAKKMPKWFMMTRYPMMFPILFMLI